MALPSLTVSLPRRVAVIAVMTLALLAAGCQFLPQSGSPGTPMGPPAALAVDPADGSLLQVAGGLFRSRDEGRTWEGLDIPSQVQPTRIRQVATGAQDRASLLAAGPGAGILRSDDRGRNWRPISQGLPSQDVIGIAVHAFLPETIFASIEGKGVFRTEDGGTRWQKMDDGPPVPISGLVHSPLEGSMNTGWLYAAAREAPYLSMDCF